MSAAVDMTVRDFLAALAARTPSPASGSGTAITGAIAAAIAELAARFSDEEAATAKLQALRAELTKLADEDAAAYAAFMESRSDEDRDRTIDVPLAIAEAAAAVRDLGARVAGGVNQSVRGDAEAAAELARAVAHVGARLVEINLGDHTDDPRLERARAAAAR